MKQYIVKSIGIYLLFAICTINAQNDIIDSNQLESFTKAQIEKYNLVAMNSALILKDEILWSNSVGYKDIDLKNATQQNTLFHMGSLSKTITLASFLHLCEEYNIDLDENINDYLSVKIVNPHHLTIPITFRMLLTHTSSINDVNVSKKENKMALYNSNTDVTQELGNLICNVLTKEGEYYSDDYFLQGEPGSEYSYSNIAYSLIGYLIEQISGQSFIDYSRENILDPLKMYNSTFLLSKTDTTNFAYQYILDQNNGLKKVTPYTWAGYMDGSFRTNLNEYANFLIMIINKGNFQGVQVLKESTIETMLEIQDLPGEQPSRSFKPLGRTILWNKIEVDLTDRNVEIYHFNGFGAGFFTEAFFSVDEIFAGMFFTTGQFESFPKMGRAIQENITQMLESIQ